MNKITKTDYFVYGGIALFVGGAMYFTYSQVKKLKEREKELTDVLKKADDKMEEFENCCLATGGMSNMAKMKVDYESKYKTASKQNNETSTAFNH